MLQHSGMEKLVSFIIILLAAALFAQGCMAEVSTSADVAQVSGVLEPVPQIVGTTNVVNTSEEADVNLTTITDDTNSTVVTTVPTGKRKVMSSAALP